MANFAIISGNIVENIIVVDDKEQAEKDLGVTLIEYTNENPAGIGWTYDAETNTFSPPVIEEEIQWLVEKTALLKITLIMASVCSMPALIKRYN